MFNARSLPQDQDRLQVLYPGVNTQHQAYIPICKCPPNFVIKK